MRAARSCGLGDTFPWSHGRCVIFGDPVSISNCMDTAETAAYLARWRPSRQVSEQAARFARQVVAGCGPLTCQDRAKNLLWAASRLACYGISIGLEPVPEVLLHPSVIERFAAHAPGLSPVA